jgi:hypothetical protein
MYKSFVNSMLVVIWAFFVASCTSWHNSHLSVNDSPRQLEIDNGYCKSVSFGSVQMPEIRQYQTSPGPYTIQTYGQIYDPYGGGSSSYRATSYVTPLSTDNFGSGLAQGMQIGNAVSASQARGEIYRGCMMNLGWSDSQRSEAPVRVAVSNQGYQNETEFYNQLGNLIPNYAAINSDPRFHEWLKARDPATGKQRQLLLVDAERKQDAQAAAVMFKQFLSTI